LLEFASDFQTAPVEWIVESSEDIAAAASSTRNTPFSRGASLRITKSASGDLASRSTTAMNWSRYPTVR